AYEGGADRIEICTALGLGGVTPSHGLISAAIAASNGLPVYVLLRPRAGNFVYSDAEFKLICDDLEQAANLGASGFVTGILTAERTVDESRMRRLIKLAGAKEVTFHRAFDQTHNLEDALEQIIAVGCRRLLTSGGKPTVQAGLDTIPELAQRARDRLRIAAGGGLTPVIAAELGRITSVDLHVSLQRGGRLRASRHDPLWDNRNVTAEISVEDVRKMATIIAGYQAR